MSFEVYDYRTTNRNVLTTPEIRARLYHMKPGQVDRRHSHDLGHEVFLILEGRAAFEIGGETKELGPGQMCVARADELHQVRNLLPDRPTIMYLSVTPHIQPTHTVWQEDGTKAPPLFRPNSAYDVEIDASVSPETLAERHLETVEAFARTAEATSQAQRELVAAFKEALAAGDRAAALEARDAMWAGLYPMFKEVYELAEVWNEFSSQTAASDKEF